MNCNLFLPFIFITIFVNNALSLNLNYLSDKNDTLKKEIIIINKLSFSGNKITKDRIINREILFKTHDTINKSDLNELLFKSKQNLLNTSLFNFVNIDTTYANNNSIDINFSFVERWYTFPIPIIEMSDRNFNSWWKAGGWSRTDFGLYLMRDNFRGRKELLRFLIKGGFNEQFEIYYSIPYIDKKQRLGIGFSFDYIQNHEVQYKSIKNKLEYLKLNDKYLKKDFMSFLELTYRKSIHNTHLLRFGYNYFNFADTLIKLNNNYTINTNLNPKYLTLYYLFKNDYRDDKSYPLNGHYFDIHLVKNGLKILNNEIPDIFYVYTTIRKFWKIKPRWYYAAGITAKLSDNKFQPYFIQKGLGYDNDFVRGYEYYVVDGQHFISFKTNFKYELVPKQVVDFSFIKTEKFSKMHYAIYLNVYSDIGYCKDKYYYINNQLTNNVLYGFGLGLDYVTYYDRVLRLEYSINKQGESGFYVHFISPI